MKRSFDLYASDQPELPEAHQTDQSATTGYNSPDIVNVSASPITHHTQGPPGYSRDLRCEALTNIAIHHPRSRSPVGYIDMFRDTGDELPTPSDDNTLEFEIQSDMGYTWQGTQWRSSPTADETLETPPDACFSISSSPESLVDMAITPSPEAVPETTDLAAYLLSDEFSRLISWQDIPSQELAQLGFCSNLGTETPELPYPSKPHTPVPCTSGLTAVAAAANLGHQLQEQTRLQAHMVHNELSCYSAGA